MVAENLREPDSSTKVGDQPILAFFEGKGSVGLGDCEITCQRKLESRPNGVTLNQRDTDLG